MDSGIYGLTAVNMHGFDSAKVTVNVVAPPASPEGPLEVSDIHKNGCILACEPPKCNGGSKITGYVFESLDVDSGIWSIVGRTEELSILVEGLNPGKEYEFRVRADNEGGESEYLKTSKSRFDSKFGL